MRFTIFIFCFTFLLGCQSSGSSTDAAAFESLKTRTNEKLGKLSKMHQDNRSMLPTMDNKFREWTVKTAMGQIQGMPIKELGEVRILARNLSNGVPAIDSRFAKTSAEYTEKKITLNEATVQLNALNHDVDSMIVQLESVQERLKSIPLN